MKTPAEVYRPSSRRPVVRALGTLPRECELRSVDKRGYVEWKARRVYVTCGVAGHAVGVRQQGEVTEVWFYHLLIGTFRDGDITVQPVAPTPTTSIANGAADAHSALLGDSSADGPAPKDAAAPDAVLAGLDLRSTESGKTVSPGNSTEVVTGG
jgi:hypothetical protein